MGWKKGEHLTFVVSGDTGQWRGQVIQNKTHVSLRGVEGLTVWLFDAFCSYLVCVCFVRGSSDVCKYFPHQCHPSLPHHQ